MSREPYLMRLASMLQEGLLELHEARCRVHTDFVLKFQADDGGFRGREGGADLYYTSFAVRCLSMLGTLQPQSCAQVGTFLRQFDPVELDTVDILSWLYSALIIQAIGGVDVVGENLEDWKPRILTRIESLRRDDGGYAKNDENPGGSTYHSFLSMLVYELLGERVPRPNAFVQFAFDRQRDDGGFVEIAPMNKSGTNPTAAAAAIINEYFQVDDETRADITDFLRDVRSGEGGFQANTKVPFADGLSTFTGLLTAHDLELEGILLDTHVREFIKEWLELPTGGFRAASWDDQADVEYTFYGLGLLALVRPTSEWSINDLDEKDRSHGA